MQMLLVPESNSLNTFSTQVRGTIFNELDDDKLYTVIDFCEFEERFKLAALGKALVNGDSDIDGLSSFPSKRFKKPDMISLLEHTRLRNIGELALPRARLAGYQCINVRVYEPSDYTAFFSPKRLVN